jgi:FkbM family methyltransferase
MLEALDPVIGRRSPRLVAVQAGGHVGIVPELLAARFDRVYTFEPEPRNFAALVDRCPWNVYPFRAAVGDGWGPRALIFHPKSSGGHAMDTGTPGPVPCISIDDLRLDACDLIQIDVEGRELPALMGARETIVRFLPIICVEENKKSDRQRRPGELVAWLRKLGYAPVAAAGEDLIFEAKA